jgi:hypothetical protein
MLLSGKKAEMFDTEKILFDGNTKFAHYQVIDMHYVGRPARVLFSGQRAAAQSAIPRDGNPAMLFDYNQRFMAAARLLYLCKYWNFFLVLKLT